MTCLYFGRYPQGVGLSANIFGSMRASPKAAAAIPNAGLFAG